MKIIKKMIILVVIIIILGFLKVNNVYNIKSERKSIAMQEDNVLECDFYTEYIYSSKKNKKIKIYFNLYPFDFRILSEKKIFYINGEETKNTLNRIINKIGLN